MNAQNYQELLIALLKAEFSTEKDLLKKHESLLKDGSFVRILEEWAVRARESNLEGWAKIQYLLGLIVYYYPEDSTNNLEQAIAYLEKALTIYSCNNFPVEYVTIHNYLDNINIVRQKLLKKLLTELLEAKFSTEKDWLKENKSLLKGDSFIRSLKQRADRERESNLENWAKIQYLLGLVTYYYPVDSTDRLEKAIAYLKKALTIYSRADFPFEWATIQNYLGNIVRHLLGEKSPEQIKKAIAHHHNALEVRKKSSYPEEWKSTQYNLGVSYGMLAKLVTAEEQAKYYFKARDCFEKFLSSATPDKEDDYAGTKIAIGAITQQADTGDKVRNLYYALSCYQEAKEIAEAKSKTKELADAWEYLGHGYSELRKHENRADNLQKAYHAYQNALEQYHRPSQDSQWAATKNSLGLLLIEQQQATKAIKCFEEALTVFNPKSFPFECSQTARNLGNLASQNKLWEKAIAGYEVAIKAVENMRSQIYSSQERQKLAKEYLDVYCRLVEACIKSGNENNLAKAIETVERSRNSYLVNLNLTNELYKEGGIPPEAKQKLAEFEKLQERIDARHFQYEKNRVEPEEDSPPDFRSLAFNNSVIPPEVIEELEDLERKKAQAWLQLRDINSKLARKIRVEPIKCDRIKQLVDSPYKAIVRFYSATSDTYIFVLRQSGISYHLCSNLSLKGLNQWLNEEWFQPYQKTEENSKKSWIARMELVLQKLAYKLDLERLIDDHLQGVTELTIVPHQLLHLMPFSALPLADGKYLCDRFILQIAPSCKDLVYSPKRKPTASSFGFGTVVHSLSGLPSSKIEEKLIASLYNIPDTLRLQETDANKENYHDLLHQKRVRRLLSSHHAKFDPQNPLNSQLTLHNSRIELRELLTYKWSNSDLEEVFLNCCETGSGIPTATDELLTIAAAFLSAGVRSVVSSLWVVEDSSAALLSYFYHQARLDGLSSPYALQQAQIRLRNISQKDLYKAKEDRDETVNKRRRAENTPDAEKYRKEYLFYLGIYKLIGETVNNERSLHPFYWAAFTCQGSA